ncbi:uncharacterized protein LOC129617830 [Condylostylus longicornis]|uniref:uncharacterized protein LOC129617830 n=1 Tax=Condylostylus longicornis TaxID=2530218 RepID=UPI00244DCA2C|nr:uncharacterized protein LOC129617830 [Condylostylus longicornis]
MAAPFVDFYKRLSISPKATTEQIKSAFFKLAKSCHPDINTTGGDAKFKQINDAYQTLTKNRSAYDTQYATHYKRRPSSTFTSRASNPSNPSNTSNSSTSPFEQAGRASAFHWGDVWTQPESKREKQRKPRATEKPQTSKEKEFDKRFFWSDGCDEYWYNHDCEDYLDKKKSKGGKRRFIDEEELIERELMRQERERRGFDEYESDDDEDEFEFLEFVTRRGRYDSEMEPSDIRTTNRLSRKVLQRIRENPRLSDVGLLRKFGLDPRLFGLDESDLHDQEVKAASTERSEAERRGNKKRHLEREMKEDKVAYDFEDGCFKWKEKMKRKNKHQDHDYDENLDREENQPPP